MPPFKPIDEIDDDFKPVMTKADFWDTKKPEPEQEEKQQKKAKAKQVMGSVKNSFKDKFSPLKKFLNLEE